MEHNPYAGRTQVLLCTKSEISMLVGRVGIYSSASNKLPRSAGARSATLRNQRESTDFVNRLELPPPLPSTFLANLQPTLGSPKSIRRLTLFLSGLISFTSSIGLDSLWRHGPSSSPVLVQPSSSGNGGSQFLRLNDHGTVYTYVCRPKMYVP